METQDMTENQHQEYQAWKRKVTNLNDKINNLPVWNSYAESLQREYDILLLELDPRLKWKNNN